MTDESDWVSAHAFYHGELDHLVTRAVAPLLDELDREDAVRGWFFLRYWERGPHLRLRILPVTDRRTDVRTLVRDRLAEYLRTHPSADRMRPDEYAHVASTLGRWERMDSYAEHMHPNNTVSFIPYRREHNRYGHGAAIEAVEHHFAASSRIALRLLTMRPSPDQRVTTAYAAILVTWLIWQPDPKRLAAMIPDTMWSTTGSMDPPGLDQETVITPRQREKAVEVARRLRRLAATANELPHSGTLRDWSRSVITLRDTLMRETTRGSLAPPVRDGDGRPATAADSAGVLPVLDLCAHLFCNRLGLHLAAESAIRKLAAEAVRALAAEQTDATDGKE